MPTPAQEWGETGDPVLSAESAAGEGVCAVMSVCSVRWGCECVRVCGGVRLCVRT